MVFFEDKQDNYRHKSLYTTQYSWVLLAYYVGQNIEFDGLPWKIVKNIEFWKMSMSVLKKYTLFPTKYVNFKFSEYDFEITNSEKKGRYQSIVAVLQITSFSGLISSGLIDSG